MNFQLRRDWREYSATKINTLILSTLNTLNVNYGILYVQELWNFVENVMIECIDKCLPIVPIEQNLCKYNQC